jgi:hypothetical protein
MRVRKDRGGKLSRKKENGRVRNEIERRTERAQEEKS